jgi:hypothetical protein
MILGRFCASAVELRQYAASSKSVRARMFGQYGISDELQKSM